MGRKNPESSKYILRDKFVVTPWLLDYTLKRYAKKDIVFLHKVFRGMGNFVWGGGIHSPKAICGFKAGNGLVLCAYYVWYRSSAENRRFQTHCSQTGHHTNR